MLFKNDQRSSGFFSFSFLLVQKKENIWKARFCCAIERAEQMILNPILSVLTHIGHGAQDVSLFREKKVKGNAEIGMWPDQFG